MPSRSKTPICHAFDVFPDIVSRVVAYRTGRDAAQDLDATYRAIAAFGETPTFISLMPVATAQAMLRAAAARLAAGEVLPLYGIPFAVKDNIDVAGLPTTAACPDFAYTPERSAYAVERLVAAGAIPIGKVNLDQFATGLNGTRSPYGIPTCVFDEAYISGGSSSGSAVAVAAGLVPFALGTDTAGSGRVPAAFNNLVGLKPTKGLVSTQGVVPACRSQDCVSVFAASVPDALSVTRVMAGFDPADPYSRRMPDDALATADIPAFRFGVPSAGVLSACDAAVLAGFEQSAAALERLGGQRVAIDLSPFHEAAELLYDGPWVAERLAGLRAFMVKQAHTMYPIVRDVIRSARAYSAADTFDAQHRLAALMRQAADQWAAMDVLLLPTVPEHPTVSDMLADPVGLNARLGLFTNFVNLMDLAAIAVPGGFGAEGLPVGVTLIAPAFSDGKLALLGDRLHRALPAATLAASGRSLSSVPPLAATDAMQPQFQVAVVGAHLSGQPLNHQLTERGGKLITTARTATGYSLYLLPDTQPPKPGLVRDGGAGGIEVEVWSLPADGFAAFVTGIPAPLGIGTLTLEDASTIQGFLCEAHAIAGARDITRFGGWRAFLQARSEAA